jgi:transcriptional regulator with XRE-family HTH domain
MPTRERPADVGARRALSIIRSLGDEVHEARLRCGLSQAQLARLAGVSQTRVSLIERQVHASARVADLARLLAVVGLELSARAYPGSSPVRDVAQRALLDRLRGRADASIRWRFEVPIPIAGDQRAWDAVLEAPAAPRATPLRIAVEAETRLRDVQEIQRRVALKRRDDSSVEHVVLLIAATRFNRRIVKEHAQALEADYPMSGRAILDALGHARLPAANGLILL